MHALRSPLPLSRHLVVSSFFSFFPLFLSPTPRLLNAPALPGPPAPFACTVFGLLSAFSGSQLRSLPSAAGGFVRGRIRAACGHRAGL